MFRKRNTQVEKEFRPVSKFDEEDIAYHRSFLPS